MIQPGLGRYWRGSASIAGNVVRPVPA
ncbi:hypothetical protein C1M53_19620 [Mesorhizobium sp. Pch-S]|nr:hypothetical protein C1M53_19620 [Mesorhizobium sp. Pch-S]